MLNGDLVNIDTRLSHAARARFARQRRIRPPRLYIVHLKFRLPHQGWQASFCPIRFSPCYVVQELKFPLKIKNFTISNAEHGTTEVTFGSKSSLGPPKLNFDEILSEFRECFQKMATIWRFAEFEIQFVAKINLICDHFMKSGKFPKPNT